MAVLKSFQELEELVEEEVFHSPNFIVTPEGKAIVVPEGATGPVWVKNGKGFAYIGGKGGSNEQVSVVRIMDPTEAKLQGRIPAYPKGYVKYENDINQGVDYVTGKTLSNKKSHLSLE
jgi:hypothetical protein